MTNALRLAVASCLLAMGTANAATISLFDWAYYVDGVYATPAAPYAGPGAPLPPSVDDSGFQYSNGFGTQGGLGRVSITVTGDSAHSVGIFLDHEVDEGVNTYFNETGAAMNIGQLPAGLSWEIDNPGGTIPGVTYVGDIIENFFLPLGPNPELDNQAFSDAIGPLQNPPTPGTHAGPIDVSMAMAWDFVLTAAQVGVIEFVLSEDRPIDGFYLEHIDPSSGLDVFLATALTIFDPTAAPEPATPLLLAGGLLLLARSRRRASG